VELSGALKDLDTYVPRGMKVFNPILVHHARGARVTAVDGREYIDFVAGVGTLNVGHAHPKIVAAVREQSERFIHTCFPAGMYEGYLELAKRLVKVTPGGGPKKVIFSNSGAEAIENALKIAWAATGRPAIITFGGAFHGRTLLTMTLSGKEGPMKTQYGHATPDVYRSVYPNPYRPPIGVADNQTCEHALGALRQLFVTHVSADRVAAIIVEPIQGEGGFVVPPRGFLSALRSICDQHGILLIVDEIQTGFGRTGRMFAVEHENVVPDLVVLGKSLGAGLPLSAVVGSANAMDGPEPGGLGGTYGGNPLACAAALATLDVFAEEPLLERSVRIGELMQSRLRALREKTPLIGDVRGVGAMVAIELVRDRSTREPAPKEAATMHERCLSGGLLLAPCGVYNNVMRFLVPLVATDEDVDAGLRIIESAFEAEN
jgi:4-aminobutyrate aminotransferase/(S)-3-amino-2-methylpropionate transaminase